jgi:hypothetical protein
VQHRHRPIELLLGVSTAGDFKMDGSELVPFVTGLRSCGAAAYSEK